MKEENKSTKKTKEKIINATIELLQTDGYFGTTTFAICERAGVSPGRINYHFGSKDGLIIQIAEMIPSIMREKIKNSLEGAQKEDFFLNAFYLDAMIIKVILTDNEIMEKYREIYSQDFICNYISQLTHLAFSSRLAHKYNLS